VTLIGGAPGGGKTALVGQTGFEMLRFDPEIRLVIASCEMSPSVLLNRQLARLSGIDAETVHHRRFGPEHEERLASGLATLESIADRVAFMEAPYEIGNIGGTVDAFRANVVIVDYVQRFQVLAEDTEARFRVNRMMDYLRQFADAGIAIIVVSAVGRSRDKAGRSSYSGDGLSLASFRETSELEYGADDALILARIDENDPAHVRLAHLKARHGRQVTQDLYFDGSVQSFTLIDGPPTGAFTSTARGPATSADSRPAVSEALRRLWDTSAMADDDGDSPDSDEFPAEPSP
jgi:replicative DNA helicase